MIALKSNRHDARLTSPACGERSKRSAAQASGEGDFAHSDSRRVPSPGSHLSMRSDLSPQAGEVNEQLN